MNDPDKTLPPDPLASTLPAPPPEMNDEIYDPSLARCDFRLDAAAWAKFSELVGWDGFASEELDEE